MGAAAVETGRSIPLVLRVLSLLGAVLIFLIGLVVSVGAIIAAPLGIWLMRRRARRQQREAGRIATLVGAAMASFVLAGLLWGIVVAIAPRPTAQELESAAQTSTTDTPKLPDWYMKAFPPDPGTDSATERAMRSPGFLLATLVLGAVFLAVLFGVVGGVTGWGAYVLARIAWTGKLAARSVPML